MGIQKILVISCLVLFLFSIVVVLFQEYRSEKKRRNYYKEEIDGMKRDLTEVLVGYAKDRKRADKIGR